MTIHPQAVVFLVDDDDSVREGLQSLLMSVGWRVEAFATAPQFLARPRSLQPHCLVLDIGLPEISGLDLRDQMAGHYRATPIIFITGDVASGGAECADKGSAFAILTKPFDEDAVLRAVNEAVETSARALASAAPR